MLIEGTGRASNWAPVHVIDENQTFGVVSGIDDTILSIWLPRPMVATWSFLVLTGQARRAISGMSCPLQELIATHPSAPFTSVSTGVRNTCPMVTCFPKRHGFPHGALPLTGWGPTNIGWFRSGVHHRRAYLREFAGDPPNIRWLLVSDDGQHDPDPYVEFANPWPSYVVACAIRQLTPGGHALAHDTLTEASDIWEWTPDLALEVRAFDGDGFADKLHPLIRLKEI